MAKKHVHNSSKAIWIILVVVILILIIGYVKSKPRVQKMTPTPVTVETTSFNFGNQKIMLDDQELTFVNGTYKSSDSTYGEHSATMMNRSVNPSGTRAAAILVDQPEGSGTFYYVVGAMIENGKETYSQPILLGDRVKIVSVRVDDPQAEDNGMITVKYLVRPADAAMAAEPTEEMTAKYSFEENGNLIEVLH